MYITLNEPIEDCSTSKNNLTNKFDEKRIEISHIAILGVPKSSDVRNSKILIINFQCFDKYSINQGDSISSNLRKKCKNSRFIKHRMK